MLIALAAAIVLAQASPAAPAPAVQPAPAAEAKPAKPAKPKMVCHDETATGSIMSHRVCRTPDQVEADRLQARRDNDALADHLAACHGVAC
jgi:hypothetical protein